MKRKVKAVARGKGKVVAAKRGSYRRRTAVEIKTILREAKSAKKTGTIVSVLRRHNVAPATYYSWLRAQAA